MTTLSHHCDECGNPVESDGSRDCGHTADVVTVASDDITARARKIAAGPNTHDSPRHAVAMLVGQPQPISYACVSNAEYAGVIRWDIDEGRHVLTDLGRAVAAVLAGDK